MINFKLWFFNFDFTSLLVLLFGIIIGFSIGVLVYLFMVLSSLNKKNYVVKGQGVGLTDLEVSEMIKVAQQVLEDKELQGNESLIGHCKNVSMNLVTDIARRYFPNSKRPLLELSVDEVLMLSIYISNRVDDLLDHKGVRMFKKIKLSTIVGIGDVKKNIDESSLMKATKKYKLLEAFNVVKGALNIVNPVYWVRKAVVNNALNFALKKICLIIIAITGEETYKIYSKNVFNKDVNINTGVEELANSINADLNDVSDDDINNFKVGDEDEETIR